MTPADLKERREYLRLTQKQVAELAGTTLRTVQYWEAGTKKMHPATAELLSMKLDDLKKKFDKRRARKNEVAG